MSYDSGYCPSCGSYGGCSCNSCSSGCSYPVGQPDYNPITVNTPNSPVIEGSQGTGGNASGNNSSVHVSVCGTGSTSGDDCCCNNGIRKLLKYLYQKSVDTTTPTLNTNTLCLYGNLIPTDIQSDASCSGALLGLTTNADVQSASITDDIVKYGKDIVSICSVSVLKFTFGSSLLDNTADLRKNFFYTPKCKCCCDCGDGIAHALYFNGLGISTYEVTIQDTLLKDLDIPALTGDQGTISSLTLVAVDCDIAIFYSTNTAKTEFYYFGIPTCKIAKFTA